MRRCGVNAFHDNPRMLRATSPARWAAPLGTFGVWALALGCAAFWGLKLSQPAEEAVFATAAPAAAAPIDTRMVARALGVRSSAAPVAAAASRFVLLGVVAGRSHRGAALIAVDGQAARPYRVGAEVVPGYRLAAVAPRRATLERVGAANGDGASADAASAGGAKERSGAAQEPLVLEMPTLR